MAKKIKKGDELKEPEKVQDIQQKGKLLPRGYIEVMKYCSKLDLLADELFKRSGVSEESLKKKEISEEDLIADSEEILKQIGKVEELGFNIRKIEPSTGIIIDKIWTTLLTVKSFEERSWGYVFYNQFKESKKEIDTIYKATAAYSKAAGIYHSQLTELSSELVNISLKKHWPDDYSETINAQGKREITFEQFLGWLIWPSEFCSSQGQKERKIKLFKKEILRYFRKNPNIAPKRINDKKPYRYKLCDLKAILTLPKLQENFPDIKNLEIPNQDIKAIRGR